MTSGSHPVIRSAFSTHVGKVHDLNEDSLGEDLSRFVWLVADGVGGHAAGEVASRVARDTLLMEVSRGRELLDATMAAHAAVVQESQAIQSQKGMGTTSVALRIRDAHCEMVWVGDSRGYLFRDGKLKQLTKDHSFMQLLIDRQHLTEEQARTHPRRNVVTQVLGFGDPVPDSIDCPLRQGDMLMLCSDGLYDELTDQDIAAILRSEGDLQTRVDRLVSEACDRGGRDNISAILVQYDGPDAVVDATIARSDSEKTTIVRGRQASGVSLGGGVGKAEGTSGTTDAPRRSSSWLPWLIVSILVAAGVLAGLWFSGHLGDMT